MRRGLACFLVALAMLPAVAAADQAQDTLSDGRRMYRGGVLPSGETLSARVLGNVPVSGAQVTCMSCHRRSGLGSIEGNVVVPGLAGSILYEPGEPRVRDITGPLPEGAGTRPPYTEETLARAIREGIDSAGRTLDPVMPRYDLGDADVAQLIAYLRSLSNDAAPGVEETTIHYATVIAGPVEAVQRSAVLDVLAAYFDDKSGDPRNQQARAEKGPWYKERHNKAFRQWRLHVWELNGAPDTWPGQLDTYYRDRPVFAVLGGIGNGDWRPIHEFCQRREVPCLLPNTDVPVVTPLDFYNVYYSKGLVVEAEALAEFIAASSGAGAEQIFVQVFRVNPRGAAPAEALRNAMQARGLDGLIDVQLAGGAPDAKFWAKLMGRYWPNKLILWLDESDLRDLGALRGANPTLDGVFLSSTLAREVWRTLPAELWSRIYLTHRYDVPETAQQVFRRTKSWLRAKGIAPSDLSIQANTLGAAMIAADAERHLLGRFSREYFIELIEHRLDRVPTDTAYPNLSLAPGQRFASKGAYIVQPASAAGGGLVPASDWIVPEGSGSR